MIDIKELKIGNLVSHDEWKVPLTVVEIKQNGNVWVDGTGLGYLASKDFEPIPLTEEWLLNFGFMSIREGKYGRVYAFYIDDFGYILNRDWHKEESYHVGIEYTDSPFSQDKDNIYNFSHEMRFVHQLQNMYFALTGEELTLKTP